jgi:hypothetical protein
LEFTQKLEICFDFCEFKSLQRLIGLQHWNVFAGLRFESHGRVNARLTAGHTHDFQDRLAMEFIVEPVLVRAEKDKTGLDRTRYRRTAIPQPDKRQSQTD